MSDTEQRASIPQDLRKGNLPPANLDLPMPSGAAVPTTSGSPTPGGQGGGQSNPKTSQSSKRSS